MGIQNDKWSTRFKRWYHWLALIFLDAEEENEFKESYEAPLPLYLFFAASIWGLLIMTFTYPIYMRETTQGDFKWDMNDPRSLFFFERALLIGLVVSIFCGIALTRKGRVSWRCETMYAIHFSVALIVLPWNTPWRTGVVLGEDPASMWIHSTDQIFMGDEIVLALSLDTIITANALFLPIRVHVVWIPNLFFLVSYLLALTMYGTPFTTHSDMLLIGLMSALTMFAWIGARRNEKALRQTWKALVQSRAEVQEQRQELNLLEARVHAMRALMSTVCEVVVYAGENLRIIEAGTGLDDLLGPMMGCCLEDRIDGAESKNSLQTVVRQLLCSSDRSPQRKAPTNAVLVPPVRFKPSSGVPLEAEVLVADTGIWNGAGVNAWRYLVGLKSVVHHPRDESLHPDVPGQKEGYVAEAPGNYGNKRPLDANDETSSKSSSMNDEGPIELDISVHGVLHNCSPQFNSLVGRNMDAQVLWHWMPNVKQVAWLNRTIRRVHSGGATQLVTNVLIGPLRKATNSANKNFNHIRTTLRIMPHSSSSYDTSIGHSIVHVTLHDPQICAVPPAKRPHRRSSTKSTLKETVSLSRTLENIPELACSEPDNFGETRHAVSLTGTMKSYGSNSPRFSEGHAPMKEYASASSGKSAPVNQPGALSRKPPRNRSILASKQQSWQVLCQVEQPASHSNALPNVDQGINLIDSNENDFRLTPEITIELACRNLMRSLVVAQHNSNCCMYHGALICVINTCSQLMMKPCSAFQFQGMKRWQCQNCFAATFAHGHARESCSICGMYRYDEADPCDSDDPEDPGGPSSNAPQTRQRRLIRI